MKEKKQDNYFSLDGEKVRMGDVVLDGNGNHIFIYYISQIPHVEFPIQGVFAGDRVSRSYAKSGTAMRNVIHAPLVRKADYPFRKKRSVLKNN